MTDDNQATNDVIDAPVETNDTVMTETNDTPEAKAPEDTPFPKKAVNAISRRDRQIGKLRAQYAALEAELKTLRGQGQQTPKAALPDENDPKYKDKTYGDYLKDVVAHQFEQQWSERDAKRQTEAESQKQAVWKQEREEALAEKASELIQANPEYKQLAEENADILDVMPAHVEHAFLEAENAHLAFLALAKEGKLESLMTMSPAQAAMTIAKAEERGAAMLKPKVTNAAAPIAAAKGTGNSSGKSPANMTTQELMAWVRS